VTPSIAVSLAAGSAGSTALLEPLAHPPDGQHQVEQGVHQRLFLVVHAFEPLRAIEQRELRGDVLGDHELRTNGGRELTNAIVEIELGGRR
jgi:hypothetical protein